MCSCGNGGGVTRVARSSPKGGPIVMRVTSFSVKPLSTPKPITAKAVKPRGVRVARSS